MTINRLDIVHAPISDSGLPAKFTLFLLLPDQSGAAAGHYTGDAVVDADQLGALLAVVTQMCGLITDLTKYHFIRCLFFMTGPIRNGKPPGINIGIGKGWLNQTRDRVPRQELLHRGTWIFKPNKL
jgi:hypothetical protein